MLCKSRTIQNPPCKHLRKTRVMQISPRKRYVECADHNMRWVYYLPPKMWIIRWLFDMLDVVQF